MNDLQLMEVGTVATAVRCGRVAGFDAPDQVRGTVMCEQMVKRLRFHPQHTEEQERLRTAMAHDVCQSCAGCMFCRKEPNAPQSPPAEELVAAQRYDLRPPPLGST